MSNTMCPKEYFERIIDLYVNARNCDFTCKNIYRGRSKIISSNVEELTAHYISCNLSNNCNYFVDQPIRMGNSTRYPDIVMQQEDEVIKHIFDLKTDTGWARQGMLGFCMEWDKRIESIKNNCTTFKNGLDKKQHKGQFSNSLKLHVIVITAKNSGKNLLNDYNKINKFNNVKLYIMSDGKHPNTYNVEKSLLINDMNIHYNEFDRLLNNIK